MPRSGSPHLRPRRLLTAIVSVVVLLALGPVAPAQAGTPPTFSGCTNIDNGRPDLAFNSNGTRYIYATLKYRCSTGKEYEFLGTLYQNPDGQGGTYVDSIYKYGIATAPYVTGDFGYCKNKTSSKFFIYYSVQILSAEKSFYTPQYTIACHY